MSQKLSLSKKSANVESDLRVFISFVETDHNPLMCKEEFEYTYDFKENFNQISIYPKKGSKFALDESNMYMQIYSTSGCQNFALMCCFGEKTSLYAKQKFMIAFPTKGANQSITFKEVGEKVNPKLKDFDVKSEDSEEIVQQTFRNTSTFKEKVHKRIEDLQLKDSEHEAKRRKYFKQFDKVYEQNQKYKEDVKRSKKEEIKKRHRKLEDMMN